LEFTNEELKRSLRTGLHATSADRHERPIEELRRQADAERIVIRTADPELEQLIEEQDQADQIEQQQHEQQQQEQQQERVEQLPEPTGETGILDKIVHDIARHVAGETINETRVREIAVEEAQKNARSVVHRIEIAGREPRDIPGVKHPVFERVLRIVSRGLHVYLTGPAGTGKSTLAEQVADALDIPFASISCHPQMTATALFGYQTADGTYLPTAWRNIFEHGGVFCVDEMDNANSSLMSALNQSLANSIAAFPDGMVKRSSEIPTIVVGTGNTFGTGPDAMYVGRQAQDGALRTRFYTIEVPVDEVLERHMIDSTGCPSTVADKWHDIIRSARKAVDTLGMRVIVSPRHAMYGAEGLVAGETFEQVAQATFLAGVPSEQSAKILLEAGI
jgi:MoxR-like ATPase